MSPSRSPNPSSGTANHPDQPKLCDVCGERVLVKDGGWYFFDDTPARKHFTRHIACMSHLRKPV